MPDYPPIDGPQPCHDNRSNARAAAYMRGGAHVFARQARGLLPLAGEMAADSQSRVRLALVIPWIKAASRRTACETFREAHEAVQFGVPCEAFGQASLPPSWPFWVASAAANADVADFLLMHDVDYDPSAFHVRAGLTALPPNVRAVLVPNMTALYRERLGLEKLRLTDDKVKDFKPMIGQVFRDYLKAYSHWAFGDIDVVYGALRNFLTPRVLAHDVISFRTDDVCWPMAKTVFAGQLSVFANNNWTCAMYQTHYGWERVAVDARFLFFDERLLPFDVLTQERERTPKRVAMVISQLTDRKSGRRPTPRRFERRLLWHADGGRLILVQSHGESSPHKAAYARCIESEYAVVHLQLFKFKHWNATISASGSRGFVYTVQRGIVPLNGSSSDMEAEAIVDLLARGKLRRTCDRNPSSFQYEGVLPLTP